MTLTYIMLRCCYSIMMMCEMLFYCTFFQVSVKLGQKIRYLLSVVKMGLSSVWLSKVESYSWQLLQVVQSTVVHLSTVASSLLDAKMGESFSTTWVMQRNMHGHGTTVTVQSCHSWFIRLMDLWLVMLMAFAFSALLKTNARRASNLQDLFATRSIVLSPIASLSIHLLEIQSFALTHPSHTLSNFLMRLVNLTDLN